MSVVPQPYRSVAVAAGRAGCRRSARCRGGRRAAPGARPAEVGAGEHGVAAAHDLEAAAAPAAPPRRRRRSAASSPETLGTSTSAAVSATGSAARSRAGAVGTAAGGRYRRPARHSGAPPADPAPRPRGFLGSARDSGRRGTSNGARGVRPELSTSCCGCPQVDADRPAAARRYAPRWPVWTLDLPGLRAASRNCSPSDTPTTSCAAPGAPARSIAIRRGAYVPAVDDRLTEPDARHALTVRAAVAQLPTECGGQPRVGGRAARATGVEPSAGSGARHPRPLFRWSPAGRPARAPHTPAS